MRQFIIDKMRAVLTFILIAGALSGSAAAQKLNNPQITKIQQQLKTRYSSGMIYVTYIPIYDLAKRLRDLENQMNGVQIISIVAHFLSTHRRAKMNEDIAFIVIDFERLKAGYKYANDNDGTLHPISWSAEEIVLAADLFDKCLRGLAMIQAARDAISAGTVSVAAALNLAAEISDNAYIPAEKLPPLWADIRVLLSKRRSELAALKQNDEKLYRTAEGFMASFDALLSRQQLESLLSNDPHMNFAFDAVAVARLQGSFASLFPEATPEELAIAKINKGHDIDDKLQAAADYVASFPKSSKRVSIAQDLASQISKLVNPSREIELLKKLSRTFSEPGEAAFLNLFLADAYTRADRLADAFRAASAVVEQNPDNIPALMQSATIGLQLVQGGNRKYVQVQGGNRKYVQQSLRYAYHAIDLIQSNKRPAGISENEWTQYKTIYLANFYHRISAVAFLTGDLEGARNTIEKAIVLSPADFNILALYVIIETSISRNDYQRLASEYKALKRADKKEAKHREMMAKVDKILPLYALAVAVTEGKPEYQRFHDQTFKDLTTFYKMRHGDSTEGLAELIQKNKPKQ